MDGIYTNIYSDKTIRLEALITSLKHILDVLKESQDKNIKVWQKKLTFL